MSMVTEFLTLTVTIRRKTIGVSSTSGGNTYTWANAATLVPCSIQVDRRSQAQRFYREDAIIEFRVYFESGTDVAVGDRIQTIVDTVSGSTLYSGDAFEVTSLGSNDVHNSEYTKVTAILKKGGGTQ